MDKRQVVKKRDFLLNQEISILVVEDDEDNQLLLKYAIAMFGWKYLLAKDAVTTISVAKEKQPDLILLDIVMPDISGFQIANMLKSSEETKDIPLIAVTGLIGEEEQNLMYAIGFDDYINKPYSLDDLQEAIAQILNKEKKAFTL